LSSSQKTNARADTSVAGFLFASSLARISQRVGANAPPVTGGQRRSPMVYVGDELTTLPSREIDPKTARKIRKHLGLAK
jgi:hypothetical protein